MKLEIKSLDGTGRGTEIWIDGEKILNCKRLSLEIDAVEPIVVKLELVKPKSLDVEILKLGGTLQKRSLEELK